MIDHETVAIKSDCCDPEIWTFYEPQHASTQIIASEPSHIMTGTRESITLELEMQHPSEDSGQTYVTSNQWGVAIWDEPVFIDSEVAIERLKQNGQGKCKALINWNTKVPDGFHYWSLRSAQHPITGKDLHVSNLSYDLEAFKRQKAERQKKDAKKLANRDDLWRVMRRMVDLLPVKAAWQMFSVGDNTPGVVDDFIKLTNLFNWAFGKNAHRQVEEFQQFKAHWSNHAQKNRNKFLKLKCHNDNNTHVKLFVEWMEREVKIRKPRKRELVSTQPKSIFEIPNP